MKYGFALVLILVVLFSLSAVAADENTTSSDDALSGADVKSDSDDNLDGIDLSVKADAPKKAAIDNTTVIDLPVTVTASVDKGVAHDTKIQLSYNIDEYFEYISHNTTMGTYNTTTRIWDIGDLTSSNKAVLTMLVKFNPRGKLVGGTFILISNAQTSSNDTNTSNNFLVSYLTISSGSVVVVDSDEKEGPNHDEHEKSEHSSHVEIIIDSGEENPTEPPVENDSPSKEDSPSEEDSNSNSYGGENQEVKRRSDSKSAAKEISNDLIGRTLDSLVEVHSNVPDSLVTAIDSLFDLDNNSGSDNSSDSIAVGHAYDYTRIPLMIFSVFLIILVAVIGYDRLKS